MNNLGKFLNSKINGPYEIFHFENGSINPPTGSLIWAYYVAKTEGQVYWHNERYYINENGFLTESSCSFSEISEQKLSNWYRRPKSDKEIYLEEIRKEFTGIIFTPEYIESNIKKILKNYEVKRKIIHARNPYGKSYCGLFIDSIKHDNCWQNVTCERCLKLKGEIQLK